MKTLTKIIAVAMLVTVGAYQLNAQGLYINAGLGYGMAAGKSMIGATWTTTDVEGVYGSYGEGLNLGVGVGYMFNENIGAELGFSYLMGSKFEVNDDWGLPDPLTIEYTGKMMRIIPAIKISTGDDMKVYGKFGLVLGLGAGIDGEISGGGSSSGTAVTYSGSHNYSGGSAMGWMAACGVEFPAGDKLSIYAELNMINQTYGPDETDYTFTATDGTNTISDSGKIKLEDSVSLNSVDMDLKEYFPFGSFGIGAGIKYTLGD